MGSGILSERTGSDAHRPGNIQLRHRKATSGPRTMSVPRRRMADAEDGASRSHMDLDDCGASMAQALLNSDRDSRNGPIWPRLPPLLGAEVIRKAEERDRMREHQSEAKSTSEGTTGTVRPWPAWACPAHQRPLETRDVALACSRGDRYPVEGGIPRFVPGSNYASAFGAQWNRYRLTQLDKHTGLPITRDRFWQAVGAPSGESLTGLQVLECGCGAGRFTEVLLDSGAHVTSVDLSDAVDANAINFLSAIATGLHRRTSALFRFSRSSSTSSSASGSSSTHQVPNAPSKLCTSRCDPAAG